MRQSYLFTSLLIFFLAACKKTGVTVVPTASFTVSGYGFFSTISDNSLLFGTHDVIILSSQVTGASSIAWNFGNGATSNESNPTFSFDSAGTYTITLSAINSNGIKTVVSKKVKIFERVVTSFSINNLYLNKFAPSQNGLPVFTKANLWIEIKQSQSANDTITPNGDVSAPTIYKSAIFTDVDSSYHGALSYNIPNHVVVNYPVQNATYPIYPSKSRGTILNLYAQNNAGTYLLASSRWSGLGIMNGGDPTVSLIYGLQFIPAGMGATITLNCIYQ